MNRQKIEDSFFFVGKKTLIVEIILFILMLIGFINYISQLRRGLIVTDLADKIFWLNLSYQDDL